ncbi:SPOR domain-containing protein [Spirosoma soli]|uniref:SPOR domain-containing protein n=1 Tax=Spirosoma soli TaxID=1770529 RepID=A0ABW5M2Q5_9BACT
MASVNAYLKKLLYQYDCVVVPELGAFLTHYQAATFTETSGLYLPPRKRVAFNEALRLDDGILANYIMLHEPVTRDGAQRYISQFVSELRQQVQETGHFEIDGIGTFSRNDEGRLQFDPSLRHNFFGEAFGLNAIPAQSLTQQSLEAIIVEPSTTALGPVLAQEDTTTLIPLRRSRPYWRVAAAALLVGSLGVVSYFSVIKPGEPFQSSLAPSNLLDVPAVLRRSTTVDIKETPKPVIVRKALPTPAATPEAKLEAVPTERTVEPKPVLSTTSKPAAVASTPVVKPIRTSPYFTVIAGSFTSKRNAMRLRRQLRKAGYKDAFVIIPSQKGQLYKVAAAGSADRVEAVASMGAISELAGTSAWIYKN